VLCVCGGSNAGAIFSAATFEHFLARAGAHAIQKTVTASAFSVVGIESSFWHR
jgi:hypothetical protein